MLFCRQLDSNKIPWAIEDANGIFRGLNSLLRFHLAWNNIKSINKNAFVGLNSLEYLDLSGNNITSVQKNAFAEMPVLKVNIFSEKLFSVLSDIVCRRCS